MSDTSKNLVLSLACGGHRPRPLEALDGGGASDPGSGGHYEVSITRCLTPRKASLFRWLVAALRRSGSQKGHRRREQDHQEAVAALFRGRAQAATAARIDGAVGVRVAPAGQLLLVLRPTIVDGRIVAIEAVADRDSLAELIIDELPA